MGNKIKVKKDEMDKHPMSYLFKGIDNREKIKYIEIEEIFPGAIVMSAEVEEDKDKDKNKNKNIPIDPPTIRAIMIRQVDELENRTIK